MYVYSQNKLTNRNNILILFNRLITVSKHAILLSDRQTDRTTTKERRTDQL